MRMRLNLLGLRTAWLGAGLLALSLLFGSAGQAAQVEISLAAPVYFAFREAPSIGGPPLSGARPTGYYVDARAENGWGVGGGKQVIAFRDSPAFLLVFESWNLSRRFDLAGLGLILGYGLGFAKLECAWCRTEGGADGSASVSNQGNLQELILGLDLPLGENWKFGLGYREIRADTVFSVESASGGSFEAGKMDLSGSIVTAGFTLRL